MVGDHEVDAALAGVGNGLQGRNPRVARDDQPGALVDDLLERRQVDAVSFRLSERHVIRDLAV